jgi:hypothetical protein
MGSRSGIAHCLEGWASVAGGAGRPEQAARLFGAAEALRDLTNTPRPPADVADYDRTLAALRAALGEEAFAAAWAAGQAMSLDEAVALALEP